MIHYAEAPGRATDFDAELGGNDTFADRLRTASRVLGQRLPWAAGRREAVLERVGQELARSEGRDLRFVVHRGGVNILVRRK
ncbi:MAG TPA: hypothetical protein VMM18_01035 [Gemmatimonadaceae bacterium]|nr:hypothetical protein [Gemmatimonadaceae bacterium]